MPAKIKGKTKECDRNISRSKYEHTNAENRIWWDEVFDKLEKEASIPPDRRADILEKTFPTSMIHRIMTILSVDTDEYWETDDTMSTLTMHSKGLIQWSDVGESSLSTVSNPPSQPPIDENISPKQAKKLSTEAGPNNPYLRFFKRRPDRAAIWRTLPPLSLDEMNLQQKADAITEMIASNFIQWLKDKGEGDNTTLDVRTIMKMFDIGLNNHAATSLCVRVKELPSVTETLAANMDMPEISRRQCIRKQIQRDRRAAKMSEKKYAFGTSLPPSMRREPDKIATEYWVPSTRIRKDLVSMAAVWDGITELRSTRAYCEWLLEHPEITRPRYLEDNGILTEEFLKGPHYSIETRNISVTIMPPGVNELGTSETKMPTTDTEDNPEDEEEDD